MLEMLTHLKTAIGLQVNSLILETFQTFVKKLQNQLCSNFNILSLVKLEKKITAKLYADALV